MSKMVGLPPWPMTRMPAALFGIERPLEEADVAASVVWRLVVDLPRWHERYFEHSSLATKMLRRK